MYQRPTILIDSNEVAHGHNYRFQGWPTQVASLETGDYSLLGYESSVVCERKTKADLFSCVGGGASKPNGKPNRERFIECLVRLAALRSKAIIVVGDIIADRPLQGSMLLSPTPEGLD